MNAIMLAETTHEPQSPGALVLKSAEPRGKDETPHMPTDLTGLIVALLAIAPGYVATVFWARARTRRTPGSDFDRVLQSLTFSLIIQVIAALYTIPVITPVRAHLLDHTLRLALWVALSVFVIPIPLGVVLGKIEDRLQTPVTNPGSMARWRKLVNVVWPPAPPSVWDWYFTEEIPPGSIVVVEFGDGSRIAGSWEDGSFAATSPEPHGLILARQWGLDDQGNPTDAAVEGSAGVIVPNESTIKSIRVVLSTP